VRDSRRFLCLFFHLGPVNALLYLFKAVGIAQMSKSGNLKAMSIGISVNMSQLVVYIHNLRLYLNCIFSL
jgi:hypothetical protein